MTPPAELSFCEGSPGDIAEVMVTMAEAFDPAFGEAWTAAQCLGILGLPGVWISLARHNGTPVGFALSRVILDEAELLLLGVRPEFRGRNFGTALLERTMLVAATMGAGRLHLEVRQGNGAYQLYTRAGFAEIGRRRGYYRGADGRSFDAITLSLRLASGEKEPHPGLPPSAESH